jgi:hypothetical protein
MNNRAEESEFTVQSNSPFPSIHLYQWEIKKFFILVLKLFLFESKTHFVHVIRGKTINLFNLKEM